MVPGNTGEGRGGGVGGLLSEHFNGPLILGYGKSVREGPLMLGTVVSLQSVSHPTLNGRR